MHFFFGIMSNLCSFSSLKRFLHDIFEILKETDKEVIDIWYEPLENGLFKNFSNDQVNEILENFNCIKMEKGNYKDYMSINKISFIIESMKFLDGIHVKQLSEILDFNAFEQLIQEILLESGYFTVKNFRFSDRSNFKSKTKQGKYEIDVIGIHEQFLLVIDAKQWRRKDSFGALNNAADMQLRRVQALKHNPEAFSRLIQELMGVNPRIKKKLPYVLIPLMVTIEDNHIRMNDNQVPLVSISTFNSFLQELPLNLHYFKIIKINKVHIQTQLF